MQAHLSGLGIGEASRVLFVADGAAWIWRRVPKLIKTLGLKRLIALIDPAHEASIRTAEKAGLRFEKEVELDGVRSAVYAVVRASWPQ